MISSHDEPPPRVLFQIFTANARKIEIVVSLSLSLSLKLLPRESPSFSRLRIEGNRIVAKQQPAFDQPVALACFSFGEEGVGERIPRILLLANGGIPCHDALKDRIAVWARAAWQLTRRQREHSCTVAPAGASRCSSASSRSGLRVTRPRLGSQ